MLKEKVEEHVAARRAARASQDDAASQSEVKLRQAVATMGSAGECGLRRVAAMSRIALLSLESPNGIRSASDIAEVLRQIELAADDTLECILNEATEVGCMERDDGRQRRRDAVFAERRQAVSELAS